MASFRGYKVERGDLPTRSLSSASFSSQPRLCFLRHLYCRRRKHQLRMIAPSFEKKMVKQNLRGVAWHAYNSWLLMACGVAFVHMAHVSLELIYLEQLLNGHVIWHKMKRIRMARTPPSEYTWRGFVASRTVYPLMLGKGRGKDNAVNHNLPSFSSIVFCRSRDENSW
jgi:hypothetical protein